MNRPSGIRGKSIVRSGLTGLVILVTAALQAGTPGEPAPDVLRKQLHSSDRNTVLQAVRQVAEWGPLASDLVPDLIRLLKSDDLLLRHETAAALGQTGPAAASAVEPLISLLGDSSVLLQRSAADALGQIGAASAVAVPRLASLMKHSREEFLKVALARALIRIQVKEGNSVANAIDVLVAAMQKGDDAIRVEASMALAEAGEPAVDVLTGLVGHSSPGVCWSACDALGEMGPVAARAVPSLIEAVSGAHADHHDVCWHSARALGKIHARPQQTVPALADLLSHRHARVRVHAAYALAAFGHDARSAVPGLIALLQDDDVDVRVAAARALGTTGSRDAEMVAALDAVLDDPSGAVTVAAAESLARAGSPAVPRLVERLKQPALSSLAARVLADIGPAAEAAVPQLLAVLSSDDEAARREAVLAIAQIGAANADVENALITIMQTREDAVRPEAAFALARLKIRSAIPLLQAALRDGSSAVRLAAAWGLVTLEPDNESHAATAVPLLIESLQDESPGIRREAAATLGRLGEKASSAVPALTRAARDSDPLVRLAAVRALVECEPGHSAAVEAVTSALNDTDSRVRHAALYAAGRIGPAAQPAGPRIRRRLASREALERFHAAWALVRVFPDEASIRAEAIPDLIAGLHFSKPGIRAEAAATLGLIRPATPEIRQALEAATSDEHPSVQAAARQALGQP